jgi:hypothetical protein
LDWSAIITIVLGSSLLSAILNNFFVWLVKHTEESTHATFIALNLAHLFEKYAYACVSASEDHDTAESSDGHVGAYINNILELPELPNYEYRIFDLSILDKVFDFPQQINFAKKNLSFAFQVLDGEDAVKEGHKSCLLLAREALNISDSLRKKYDLEKRQLEFGEYSVRERLRESLAKMKVY